MPAPVTQTQYYSASMGATFVSPWFYTGNSNRLICTLACGAISAPAGAITIDATPDTDLVAAVIRNSLSTPPADMQIVDATALWTVTGTALAAGYNGVGAKFTQLTAISSSAALAGTYAAVRFRYTRTSGGASDTLQIRVLPVLQFR